MNELIFFTQILLLTGFGFYSLKLGKEALISWLCLQAIIANLFVIKQINLFGFNVTSSDAYMVGSLLCLNLLQEYFGSKEARKASFICFALMFFFTIISVFHLVYIPSSLDISHQAFSVLLSPTPRIFLASVSVFYIVQQIDVRLFSYLKQNYVLSLTTRLVVCLLISQLLDTILFSFLGLYGIVSSLFDVIILSFFIKLVAIASITSIIKLVKIT